MYSFIYICKVDELTKEEQRFFCRCNIVITLCLSASSYLWTVSTLQSQMCSVQLICHWWMVVRIVPICYTLLPFQTFDTFSKQQSIS